MSHLSDFKFKGLKGPFSLAIYPKVCDQPHLSSEGSGPDSVLRMCLPKQSLSGEQGVSGFHKRWLLLQSPVRPFLKRNVSVESLVTHPPTPVELW